MNYILECRSTMPQVTKKAINSIRQCLNKYQYIDIFEKHLHQFDEGFQNFARQDLRNQIQLEILRYAIQILTLPHPTEHPTTFITTLLSNQKVNKAISEYTVQSLKSLLAKDQALDNILNRWNRVELLTEDQSDIQVIWDEEIRQQDLNYFREDQGNKLKQINYRLEQMNLSQSTVHEGLIRLKKQFEQMNKGLKKIDQLVSKLLIDFGYQKQRAPKQKDQVQFQQLKQAIIQNLMGLTAAFQSVRKQKQNIQSKNQTLLRQQASYQQQTNNIKQELISQITNLKQELKLQTTASQEATKKLQNIERNLKGKIRTLQTQNKTCNQYNQLLLQQKQELTKQISQIKQSLNQQNQRISAQLTNITNNYSQKQSELLQALACLSKLKAQNQQLQLALSLQKQKIQQLEMNIQNIEAISLQIQQNLLNERFFSHEILCNRPEENKFLSATLKSRYNSTITSTKLLCKFDPLSKINFHKYIDNIPCIMFLAKINNQNIVAGFSLSPLFFGCKSQDALIIAVSSRQVFYLKVKGKGVTYDEYFLIFGNSELRIKSGDLQIFSNFGVNNSYFDTRGLTVDTLLGHGKDREVKIQRYEIYEVTFKDKPYVAEE